MATLQIHDLEVLHYNDAISNKVWGYFWINDKTNGQEHYKFWGKATASKFQLLKRQELFEQDENRRAQGRRDPITAIFKDLRKKKDKGYKVASFGIRKNVETVLSSQLSVTVAVKISEITQEEMDRPIKPSEVYFTSETDNEIAFFGEKGNLLGVRPLKLKDTIFDHLEKTKIPSDSEIIKTHNYTAINITWKLKEV